MTEQSLEKRLQTITFKYLRTTRHGSLNPDYQYEQFSNVLTEIERLSQEAPELKLYLENNINIIPEQPLSLTECENIGISASFCLVYMAENPSLLNKEDTVLREILILFFSKADDQSREKAKTLKAVVTQEINIENRLEEITQTFNRFMADISSDLAHRQDILMKALRDKELDVEIVLTQIKTIKEDVKKARETVTNAENVLSTVEQTAEQARIASEAAHQEALIAKTSVDKSANLARRAKLTLDHAEKTADSMVPNMLTTLGIFVAIVVAIVACYLSVILTTPDGEVAVRPLPIVFLSYLLMGHIMSTIIFLLLYLVSRLSGHSIQCRCSEFELVENPPENVACDCDKCKYKCSTLPRFRLRYAYFFAINIIFLIGYILLGIWQVINLYYREWFDNLVTENPFIMVLLILLFIFSITSILVTLFRGKKEEKIPKTSKI